MKKLFTILAGLLITVSMFGQNTVGTSISNTPIGLEHDPEGIIFKANTDAKGQVSTKLEKGEYKLSIGSVKAKQISVSIILKPLSGKPTTLRFKLNREEIQNKIRFSMPDNGTIVITILDQAGTIGAGPQKASINTCRSNIKHPSKN